MVSIYVQSGTPNAVFIGSDCVKHQGEECSKNVTQCLSGLPLIHYWSTKMSAQLHHEKPSLQAQAFMQHHQKSFQSTRMNLAKPLTQI